MSRHLSDNHRRVLSVVARNIEESLDEIEETLNRAGPNRSLLHEIKGSYSEEQRKEILGKVAVIRTRLHAFVAEFQLTPESFTEDQIVDTKITHMWILLADSFSQKLKGYGAVDISVRESLDTSVADLLRLVKELERTR
jgi:hypothetical protein